MVNSSEFGNRLQKILDYYSISATELSNQISVNRSTISHLLSGRNKPSLDFVMKMLQQFPAVELYWLMNGKGNFPSEKNDNIPSTSTFQKEVKKTLPLKKDEKQELVPDQFSDPANSPKIDRIVIFFKDGSFKSFKN